MEDLIESISLDVSVLTISVYKKDDLALVFSFKSLFFLNNHFEHH
jgi:hypothetical protein